MTHTREPWYEANTGNYQSLIVSENTGENIAVVYDRKNADIIAAVPDLLNELEWVVEYFDEHPYLTEGEDCAEACWLFNAKQTIRKAKGGK